MSLSDSLVYSAKPSAVSGTKHRQNLPTYNKASFNPGDVMMLNIPCGRRGQYLNQRMSYLKFRVENTSTLATAEVAAGTATATIQPDYTASSLFARLELYHGSNLLEQVHEYGLLHTLWMDMTGGADAQQTTGTILEGTHASSYRTGATIDRTASRYFCVPLLSGIVGAMQNKYLPTGDMSGGDLRLEITLANMADGVITGGTSAGVRSWIVKDVELMLEYVELNSEAARMISQQNAGGYVIGFDSFANYASTIETGATNANILIPARYSSLKTLFSMIRLQSNIGASTVATISSRSNPVGDAGQWYFSVGGKNIPSTPVKSNVEAFAELSKSLHTFGSVDHTSMITLSTWTAAAGSYVIATDLETLAHKSKLTESGINTLSANTHLIAQFAAGLAAPVRVDTFAHFDGILLIQNGICSVQF